LDFQTIDICGWRYCWGCCGTEGQLSRFTGAAYQPNIVACPGFGDGKRYYQPIFNLIKKLTLHGDECSQTWIK
jgi:hypothetical protein